MTTSELRKEIVKRVDCTDMTKPFKVSVRNREGKIYVHTIGIDRDAIGDILAQLSGDHQEWKLRPNWECRKFWMTSGGWPTKDFTFRILI